MSVGMDHVGSLYKTSRVLDTTPASSWLIHPPQILCNISLKLLINLDIISAFLEHPKSLPPLCFLLTPISQSRK